MDIRKHRATIVAVAASLVVATVGVPSAAAPAKRNAAATAEAASTALKLSPCDSDREFRCGTLPVPLNRRHPDGRTIPLHVEVFRHTGLAPKADGAVFLTEGGPGSSITTGPQYYVARTLLSAVAVARDLVFIDQRGLGLSAAIDCPAWQHGGPFYVSAAQCHDQLGDSANFYSTTDVADDFEDVRRALGYGQIDLIGPSYAGNDMLTYATRWTGNVRSIVVGSPALTVGIDPFYAYPPKAWPEMLSTICARSPACHASNPDPAASLAWLAARLRKAPLTGTGIDSHGVSHRVTVTENLLATAIMFYGDFIGPAEITQAAAALQRGDSVPLLRLAADVDPANGADDSGSPREMSMGHWLARTCVDTPAQWDKDSSADVRQQQYAAALKAEPSMYGPIAKAAWAHPGYAGYQPLPCISSQWEDRPNFQVGTKVRGLPALVMAGELDFSLPPAVVRMATDTLVAAKYVSIAGAGHVPWLWSDCGAELLRRFILTHDLGDASCADTPVTPAWLPGNFPVTAAAAMPAKQIGGPAAPTDLRRAATVVGWTVMDALQHIASIIGRTTPGLRGGVLTYDDALDPPFRFDKVRFTRDVAVSGALSWTGPQLDGNFTVRLADGSTATATIRGPYRSYRANLTLTLTTHGQSRTFSIPSY
jgi:pimeloyl-ACP methyl ester carboxylesterase